MITNREIVETVHGYLNLYPNDRPRLGRLLDALTSGDPITSRATMSGHVTCSALIVNPAGRVLHIRHNALNMWLRPGGHLEPGDTSLLDATMREVTEETGIPATDLTAVSALPADIDVHPIPANPAKGEGDHWHFDLRYMFTVDHTPQVVLQAEEVHDMAWLPAADAVAELHRRTAATVG